jgi:pimeloyl-ACP methyl ester carboxylesterase
VSTIESTPRHARGPVVTSRRGFFWVGTDTVAMAHGTVPRGRMFVSWEAPEEVRHPYPLVLIHGGGGQGTDYMGTPDGRIGWSTLLVQAGYAVYVVDRPAHGRSVYHPDVLGPAGAPFAYEIGLGLFAPPPDAVDAPHTQWPGGREIGDPLIDALLAPTGFLLEDLSASHRLDQARLGELLDEIGPAVLVTHSAGAPAGWLTADARPELVKGIVAVEPFGPPFVQGPFGGLPWGLTDAPMTYDPPVTDPAQLHDGTARTLPNLAGIPMSVVCGEASAFTRFDGDVVAFLAAHGGDVDQVRLADHGVHGNGHAVMFERNHEAVLDVIRGWIERRVEAPTQSQSQS